MSLLKDEQGKWSTARCAMWFCLSTIVYLAVGGPDRTDQVWKSLTEICLALVGWAGGTRVMSLVASMRRNPGPDPENTGITPGE